MISQQFQAAIFGALQNGAVARTFHTVFVQERERESEREKTIAIKQQACVLLKCAFKILYGIRHAAISACRATLSLSL